MRRGLTADCLKDVPYLEEKQDEGSDVEGDADMQAIEREGNSAGRVEVGSIEDYGLEKQTL